MSPHAAQLISQVYVGYYNRAPDAAGLNYWSGRYNAGMSLGDIAQSFSVQTESTSTYAYLANPNVASVSTFLTSVYANLFNRAPDAAGLAYWTGEINAGRSNVGNAIINIISGAQDTATTLDLTTINNKMTAGLNWATTMGNIAGAVYDNNAAASAKAIVAAVTSSAVSVTAAATSTASFFANGGAAPGQLFALTTGIDTGAAFIGGAGADTFNAPFTTAATLNAFDAINGGDGNDTLQVTSTGAFTTPAGMSILNIENLRVLGTGAVNLNTTAASLSTFTGLTNVSATGTGVVTVVGAPTTSLSATNVNPGGAATTVTGGLNDAVTVTGATASTDTVTVGSSTAAPAGTVNVSYTTNLDSNAGAVTGGAITVTGGTAITVSEVTTTTRATAANNTNASTNGTIAVTGTAATTSVSVTQSAPVTATTNSAAVAAAGGVNNAVSAARALVDGIVNITDANATSQTAANSIATVTIANAGATTISSQALTTLNLSGRIVSATASAAGLTTTNGGSAAALAANNTLTMNLGSGNVSTSGDATVGAWSDSVNNYSALNLVTSGNFYFNNATSASNTTVTLQDTALRTLNVSGTGLVGFTNNIPGASVASVPNIANANGINTAITAINVTGGASFLGDLSGMGNLSSLTGANTTGAMTVALNGTVTSFTGGTGRTVLELTAADATRTINLGTNTANELILTATGSTYQGTGRVTTTNVTGYTQLGVADSTAGATYAYDVSKFAAGINTLEVFAMAGTTTNNFTGVAAGTALLIDGATTAVTYQLNAGLSAPTSSVTVTLNGIAPAVGTGTIGYTTTALTLNDVNSFGIGTVSIVSDASVGGGFHTITTFTDPNLSTLNISGTGALVITNGLSVNTIGTLTINDSDTSTGVTNLGALTGNSLTGINFTGSHGVTIGGLTDGLASISISNVNAGTTAATGLVTMGTYANNALTNLSLSGGVAITVTDTTTSAATVSGATDNAVVSVTMLGATGVKTITLGNGNDTVVTGAANDVITLGTGANTVTAGAGADRITFGTHTGVDSVGIRAVATAASATVGTDSGADSGVFAVPATNTISTSAFDIITGMRAGDTVALTSTVYTGNAGAALGLIANGTAFTALNSVVLADNAVEMVRGTYTATGNTFVGAATGTDTLMVYDSNATVGQTGYEAVVLVGYVQNTVTGIGGTAGLITLG